ALLLYQSLEPYFGSNVFMDIDSLAPGIDFVNSLDAALTRCDVMLVLIGPTWLACADASGARRLDDAGDFVRVEVGTALQRDVRVVPVLVGGAVIPKGPQLPPDLSRLARRQAFELSDTRWAHDVHTLVDALKGTAPGGAVQPVQPQSEVGDPDTSLPRD